MNPDADGPVGMCVEWPSSVLPNAKWMFAEGQVLKRVDYGLLFARYGTTHNVGGEAGDEFRLPNFKGRTAFGYDPAQTEFDTIGETGGSKAATMPTHGHALTGAPSISPASHTHKGYTGYSVAAGALTVYGWDLAGSDSGSATLAVAAGSLAVSDATGSGDNLPPYIVAPRIVKVL